MSETVTPSRRARDSRRRARAQSRGVKYPYIRRRLRPVELLSSEAVEIIEANAETILEEVGIEFRRDPESLQLWREAGADVQEELATAHHVQLGLATGIALPKHLADKVVCNGARA